ncbi:hypothetical protein DPMN_030271 [Dreissena polymorpha]|uniref:Uncharacterized protein n=1 Tax=Dreissena polymorpha TaxID=45954 RepID=A0A9D4M2B0_DREPO|nr:hypothetical protein DPMN_030271 [Dreissena polymorpha]
MTKRRNAKSMNRNNHLSSTSMVPCSPANQDFTVTDFSSGSWPVATRVQPGLQEEYLIPVHLLDFHRILPDGRINRRPAFTLIVPCVPSDPTQETANPIQQIAPIAGYRAGLFAKACNLKTTMTLIVLICVIVFGAYLCGCFA